MTIYQPYVYIIRWTTINKGYIGVRYAKGCNPNDLFVSYHTSSKMVSQLISEVGLPDQIKIFPYADRKTALLMEEKFQLRFRVLESDYWLNQNVTGKNFSCMFRSEEHNRKISKSIKGKTHSPEIRQKISESNMGKNKGKTHTEETKRKMSKSKSGSLPWNKGGTHSIETRNKLSKSSQGKTHSEETKKKISESRKGKNHSLETRQKISESMKRIN